MTVGERTRGPNDRKLGYQTDIMIGALLLPKCLVVLRRPWQKQCNCENIFIRTTEQLTASNYSGNYCISTGASFTSWDWLDVGKNATSPDNTVDLLPWPEWGEMTADKRTPQSVNPFNHQPIRVLSLYGGRFGLIYLDPRDHSGLLGLWVFKYTGCFLFHFSLRRESAGGNWLFGRWTCLLSRSNSTASAGDRSLCKSKSLVENIMSCRMSTLALHASFFLLIPISDSVLNYSGWRCRSLWFLSVSVRCSFNSCLRQASWFECDEWAEMNCTCECAWIIQSIW